MQSHSTRLTGRRNAPLLAHLARGGTVLTSGGRDARLLRRLYDAAQLAAGREVWPTADVQPLAAWMAARWAELAVEDPALPVLLDETQAVWPWRARVEAAAAGTLLATHDLASAARSAWASLRRHAGSVQMLERQAATRDQRMFRDWAAHVERDFVERGWLDPGLMELALASQAGRLECTRELLLAGFSRHAPSLDTLLKALTRAGITVTVAPAHAGERGCLYTATDPQDELQALANWLLVRLRKDPAASLAAIIPDLSSRREEVERVLEAALQPELELPGAQQRDRVFDLAGGSPLAGLGLADAALCCLEACGARLDTRLIGGLLTSRYVDTGDGVAASTRLDLRLRNTGIAQWPHDALAAFARQESCAGFAQALQAGVTCSIAPQRRDAARWAQVFGEVLAAWRWPGAEPLASDEYQAAQALRDRLTQFAALARTAPPMEFDAALAEFSRLMQGPHQPERGEPAVYVFDRLEPPGLDFDALWVAGLGAAAWPRAASPDPFIPVTVQERLGMPGASAAACLAEAITTTAAWLGSAAEVAFSWPQRQDDAAVDKSRVLPLDLSPLTGVQQNPGQAAAAFGAGGCEELTDDPAPALDPALARGGSRLFELQSQCPFRAFAELRLGARPLELPQAGVDARQRGAVLHRVLEHAWGALAGRAGLEQDDASLEALVLRAVERALSERLPAGVGRRSWELEREWQCAAALAELRLERERGDFQVMARESPLTMELAGLPLRVVPDRADLLPDGSIVLIDYKTGDPRISQWQGARPEQPQLPLYATLLGDRVCAVAFAAVAAQQANFIGLGRDSSLLPGLKPAEKFCADGGKQAGLSWEAVRHGWADALTALAAAHLAGDAAVNPKSTDSCRYCHLGTLCRVSRESPQAEEGEDG